MPPRNDFCVDVVRPEFLRNIPSTSFSDCLQLGRAFFAVDVGFVAVGLALGADFGFTFEFGFGLVRVVGVLVFPPKLFFRVGARLVDQPERPGVRDAGDGVRPKDERPNDDRPNEERPIDDLPNMVRPNIDRPIVPRAMVLPANPRAKKPKFAEAGVVQLHARRTPISSDTS